MPILNYTTQIKTEKTVSQIQGALALAGAEQVLFEYSGKDVSAISFRLLYREALVTFRLPANIDNIYVVLQRDNGVPRKLKTREQAARVAWRIVREWLLAQLAIVEAEQAEMIEVFLPYAQDPRTGQTVFGLFQDSGFRRLTHQETER